MDRKTLRMKRFLEGKFQIREHHCFSFQKGEHVEGNLRTSQKQVEELTKSSKFTKKSPSGTQKSDSIGSPSLREGLSRVVVEQRLITEFSANFRHERDNGSRGKEISEATMKESEKVCLLLGTRYVQAVNIAITGKFPNLCLLGKICSRSRYFAFKR